MSLNIRWPTSAPGKVNFFREKANFFMAKVIFFTAKVNFFTANLNSSRAKLNSFTAKLNSFTPWLARMRQIELLIPGLQTDITKMVAVAITIAVDDTKLEESKEEIDDEDLIGYYFYKDF